MNRPLVCALLDISMSLRLPALFRPLALALVLLVGLLAIPARATDADIDVDIVMWSHPACPHCRAAHAFLDGLRARRPDLQIIEHARRSCSCGDARAGRSGAANALSACASRRTTLPRP